MLLQMIQLRHGRGMFSCDHYWQIAELKYIDMKVESRAILTKDIETAEEQS